MPDDVYQTRQIAADQSWCGPSTTPAGGAGERPASRLCLCGLGVEFAVGLS